MTFKEKLIWLKGKKVAVCEPDQTRFAELEAFLKRYGIEVVALNDVEAMRHDLESRRYSTHRVYLAVFVAAELTRPLEALWREITHMNPSLLQTPIILMGSQQEQHALQDMIDNGVFRYCLLRPVSANDILRVLRRLNRWKAINGNTTPTAILEN